jgi:hypothetical protein
MATQDEQMNTLLRIIKTGIYGKDIRAALHDSIEKTFNSAFNWFDQTLGNANQALSKATEALTTASGLSGRIAEVEAIGDEVAEEYEEISGRVDNIIAHNNDTDGNTELIDVRTTYQGYTSASAGSAVRLQARTLNQRMNEIVKTFPSSQVPVNANVTAEYSLIWTNESPYSGYTGGSIELDSDTQANAVGYVIEYIPNSSSEDITSEMVQRYQSEGPVYGMLKYPYADSDNGLYFIRRSITLNDSSISIGAAVKGYIENPFELDGTDLNISPLHGDETTVYEESGDFSNYLIPQKVYAVKMILNSTLTVQKDSEVIDARTGADGVVYSTLGEAIRSQISQYTASGIIDALNDDY